VLFAGIAPGVEDGDFVIPPGKKGSVPEHIRTSTAVEKGEEESVSARFYEWCEEQARHSL
jgi:retinol dehydrogenase-12